MIILLAAVDSNWGLARYGKIPWTLPEDMRRFKELTLGHRILMGYKTWLSLPVKALKGRMNMVLSKSHDEEPYDEDGPFFFHQLEAIDLSKDLYVIGGRQLYKQFLGTRLVDKCIITQLYEDYRCDLLFPYEMLDDMILSGLSVESEFKTLIYARKF